MISREEKNKVLEKELKKEEAVKISKKILKIFFIILILFFVLFLYIYYIGPKYIKTKEYSITSPNLPDSFDGIKILHFTDLLYGKTIDSNDLETLQKEIKLINPDIIFFTGNLVSNDYTLLEKDIANLNSFLKKMPYKIGKYAVRGNYDTSTFNLIIEETDFILLDNEKTTIYNHSTDSIDIIGLNANDIKEISNNNEQYTISLINNYDDYSKYSLSSNLIFAGNNLGGEIKLFNHPLLGKNKYMNNYYEDNNTKIYISSGLGTIHHMRFMNHPSINVYRLYVK